MIDIRDISYTQGSPLTPIHEGEIVAAPPLMPTKPPIDVSHVSVEPGGLDLGAVALDIAATPFGLAGFASTVYRGLIAGEEGMTPGQFGATQAAGLMGMPGWMVALTGQKQAETVGVQGVAPPGTTLLPGAVSDISQGVMEIKLPGLPDFGDIGKWLLVGAVAIGGLFLAGKYIGRKK